MTLWLFTEAFPYTGFPLCGLSSSDIVNAVIDKKLILNIPSSLRNSCTFFMIAHLFVDYGNLISACTLLPNTLPWSYKSIVNSRPSIDSICESLEQYLH